MSNSGPHVIVDIEMQTSQPSLSEGQQDSRHSLGTTATSISRAFLRQFVSMNSDQPSDQPVTDESTSETEQQSAAANAEQHRLLNASSLDLQALAVWIEELVPYLIFLTFVFMINHFITLCVFLWLVVVIARHNGIIRKQIALKSSVANWDLCLTVLNVLLHTAAILFLGASHAFWRQLVFLPPRTRLSVWEAIFTTAVIDSMVRFVGFIPKLLVVVFTHKSTAASSGYRRQGQLLTFIEYTMSAYRVALPAPTWYLYFVRLSLNQVFASMLAGAYLSMKLAAMVRALKLAATALKLVVRGGLVYGTYATRDEISEAGNMCAICQDPMTAALKMECGHIFCESCISEWLERDRTCPMCRAQLKPPALNSFTDGGTALLPCLF